jgi:DNA/RNA-binding domain of Phe-tRNA-synthetase-like protein
LERVDTRLVVSFDLDVSNRLPELPVCAGVIRNVCVEKNMERIQLLKEAICQEVKIKHKIETLKDDPVVRAYRDLYWKLGIDPTKTRPSGEALLRRVLHGSNLPNISTVVDAYNLASVKTIIPISGFDEDRLHPPLCVRFARSGEVFTGIGMNKSISLTEKMLVLSDEKQVLCIYPYRDSDSTRITANTRNAVITGYGAPGITEKQLKEAVETTLSYVNQVCGGKIETVEVFKSLSA